MASSAYQAELEAICPEGWKVVPLTDAVIFQEGPGILAKDFQSSGVPLIRLKGVEGDFVSLEGCNFLAPEKVASKWSHFRLERGDLVISTSASFGRVSEVTEESAGAVPYTGLIRFQPKTKEIDAGFLRAFLGSSAFMQQVEAMASGSVIRHFGPMHLKQMALPLPPLGEQRAIGNMAKLFAERLRNQSQTNETLEAIARALFKAWFVDFEPVRAKMEGRWQRGQSLPGLPAHLYDLFPDRLVESELGEIPEGWQTLPVYDIATYVNGAAFKAFQPNDEGRGLPIIKIAELKAGVTAQTKFSDVAMPEKYRLRTGDILFSWSGNPDTSIDTFIWAHGDAWLNQHIFRVDIHRPNERAFILATLKYLRPVFAEIARNKQTTGLGHVTVGDMQRLLIVKPEEQALVEWDRVAAPIFAAAFRNEADSISLARLRDTLLPKLISGQLRVPDAEACLQEKA